MVWNVGVPHSTNQLETMLRWSSASSSARNARCTGLRPMVPKADSAVRAIRCSSPLRASSAIRSAVNTGQRSTTSRSCVIAAAQRFPSGQGVRNAIGRRPALATTASRNRAAAIATTGCAATFCRTSSFSVDGTRPNRSRTVERRSAAPVAISVRRRKIARGTRTTPSPRSMYQSWAMQVRRSATPGS